MEGKREGKAVFAVRNGRDHSENTNSKNQRESENVTGTFSGHFPQCALLCPSTDSPTAVRKGKLQFVLKHIWKEKKKKKGKVKEHLACTKTLLQLAHLPPLPGDAIFEDRCCEEGQIRTSALSRRESPPENLQGNQSQPSSPPRSYFLRS